MRKRNERAEMRPVPLFSQKAMFNDWILEFDCWFSNLDTCPLSGVLDKMIRMSQKSPIPEDREADGLIGGEVVEGKREI